MSTRCTFLLLLGLLGFFRSVGQDSLAFDPVAADQLSAGKHALQTGELSRALDLFQAAAVRPLNQASTAARYLMGLAYFEMEEDQAAAFSFARFLREYPASKYVPEAHYHLGLIELRDIHPQQQAAGIQRLSALADTVSSPALRRDAQQQLRRFFFYDCPDPVLERWLARLPLSQQAPVLEALCYRLQRQGEHERAQRLYRNHRWEGGGENEFLERLINPQRQVKYYEPGVIRLALCLPFFLDSPAQPVLFDSLPQLSIPYRSQPALRFYEGFRLAVGDFERWGQKRLYLRVFDSRGDSLAKTGLLDELDALSPDLVVGDFYTTPSEQLAKWAESRATPQVVPISSSSQLVADRNQVFLAHPTIFTHGEISARYAFDSLRLRRVAVWTDSLPGTEALAQAFMTTFDTLGGEVIRLQVDSAFSPELQDDIRSTLHSLRFQQVDGMYFPFLGQQETAGLILSQMRTMNLDYPVLGSPHWWSRYDNIDRDLKESYQLVFSTSFLTERDDPRYKAFYQRYLQHHYLPPDEFAVQGYDLGRYLLQLLDQYRYGTVPLATYLRQAPRFQGLHLDLEFQGQQSNQLVNLGAYLEDGVRKVNALPAPSLAEEVRPQAVEWVPRQRRW